MTRPVRFSVFLAACTILGLIGMLVLSGVGDVAMLALACVPMLVGAASYAAHRRRQAVELYHLNNTP